MFFRYCFQVLLFLCFYAFSTFFGVHGLSNRPLRGTLGAQFWLKLWSLGQSGLPKGSQGAQRATLGAFGQDLGGIFDDFCMISWCMLGVISEHFPSWLLLNSLQLFYLGSLLSGKIYIKYSELVGTGFSNC